MESISIKIQRGDYDWWLKHVYTTDEREDEKGRCEEMFKRDLFAELHLTNHPMAEKLYDIVWQRTHRLNFQERVDFAYELVSLLEG
jgi:hypothetical protein